ncbi:MAG: DNA polymerase III subunit gamma/tau [Selenomonadaceae bacterium]|nr:DNA polymerase III subunit gamma/tau [Selenomonadaceae bacterium]
MAYEALYTRGRPKNLAQLVGQEHIARALTRAVMSNRLSHAYLLVGTRGTGKTTTARILAKTMNCETVLDAQKTGRTLAPAEIPCGKCPACLSIESSPDNVEFDAASNRSVEDITRLLSTAYMAPLQSRVKTFIIDEIHMLSNEAINSILKLIEEPPPNVAFFLATTELNKVPMTIRSRCQVLNFRLIPPDRIENYLQKFAARLAVELEDAAAKKIARLAEGSMRDAITYLDQCYAMADKKISLADVNDTLGLVSDADLDEIISAVKSQNRAEVAKSISHAFQSGLSSVSIAESLITRLRDLEFEILRRQNDSELRILDRFIDALRKAAQEMQSSGVPDIILEMTLMKLAAPEFVPVAQVPAVSNIPSAGKTLTGNLDADKKILYDIVAKASPSLRGVLNDAVFTQTSADSVTLTFKSKKRCEYFSVSDRTALEKLFEAEFGRKIKIETSVDENLANPSLDRVDAAHREFLTKTMDIFQTDTFEKI